MTEIPPPPSMPPAMGMPATGRTPPEEQPVWHCARIIYRSCAVLLAGIPAIIWGIVGRPPRVTGKQRPAGNVGFIAGISVPC